MKTPEFLNKTKFKSTNPLTILALFILLLQIIIIYFIIRPVNLYSQLNSVKTINQISKQLDLPPTELPQIGRINDKKSLTDIDTLQKNNSIDAEIYKKAQNGDYVLGYTSRLIIYRPTDKTVIYDGDTPQQLLTKSQNQLISQVQKKALEDNLITSQTTAPQSSVVTEPDLVRKGNDFYKEVEKGDIVANFSNPDLLVIYRPSTDKIIKHGKVSLTIN
jgi:hypothetical protein